MEDIKNSDILEREVFEDARKKAERILKNSERQIADLHSEWKKKTESELAALDAEFQKRMAHVWSSCVSKDTLDESPMAYKRTADIMEYLEDTVDVTNKLMPVYNYKA